MVFAIWLQFYMFYFHFLFFFFFYISAHMSIPQPLFLKDDSCYGFSHPETVRLTCYRKQSRRKYRKAVFSFPSINNHWDVQKIQNLCSIYTALSLSLSFILAFSPIKTFMLRGSDWSTGYGAIFLFFFLSGLTFPLLFHFSSEKVILFLFWASLTCLWFTCVPSAGSWSLHPSCKSALTAVSSLWPPLWISLVLWNLPGLL